MPENMSTQANLWHNILKWFKSKSKSKETGKGLDRKPYPREVLVKKYMENNKIQTYDDITEAIVKLQEMGKGEMNEIERKILIEELNKELLERELKGGS